jgi:hypothetical protein
MTSATYRQSSSVSAELEKLDADNLLLSRMPMKRMTAEQLCDTLLLVSGRLDETRSGPPQPVEIREDGLVTPIETDRGWRRSLYVEQRRSRIPTLLDSFDLPAMSPHCLQREVATVATQALHLMNNGWVDKLTSHFAERVWKEGGGDPQKQIEQAFWIALSRPPSEEEKKVSLEALKRFGAEAAQSSVKGSAPSAVPTPGGGSAQKGSAEIGSPEAEQASVAPKALQNFCHALVNSAAFLYID